MKDGGATTRGESATSRDTPLTIGVAMIGAGTIARAHAEALRVLPSTVWPKPVRPVLRIICSRKPDATRLAAERWGFEHWTTDWHDAIEDPTVDLVVVTTPNALHAGPSIAALEAGKHVICEKPLGRNAEDAREMWRTARGATGVHATGFNYRFVPAARLAWDLIRAGRLGEIHHFRGTYLKGSGADRDAPFKWRHDRDVAGLGTLGDLGSHVIDLARWLVGDVLAVDGLARTFVPQRPDTSGGSRAVTVDDAAVALLQFENGAVGTIEATRFAPGHRNALNFEVNGSKGSVRFDLERLNELEVSLDDAPGVNGFRRVLVTESVHPYVRYWWGSGHVIGWEHSFVHQMIHVLGAAEGTHSLAPEGATFEDGYRVAAIADAVVESSSRGRRVDMRASK